jgi:hypothetical protein
LTKGHSRNQIFVKSHTHINVFSHIPGHVHKQLHVTNCHPQFRSLSTNTFILPTVSHRSGLCLHTASRYQLSPTVQVSVYTQLHVTNCHPHFRSLSTHSFTLPTVTHSSGLCLHTASCYQLSATVQVSVYTQLQVTNCQPQSRSPSAHSFMCALHRHPTV